MTTSVQLYKPWANKLAAICVASSTIMFVGCSDSNNNDVSCSGSISDIAACNSNFETLNAALEAANLSATLDGGDFTVFAPTDEAFESLFSALGVTPAQFLARSDLPNILTYHVLSGAVDAATALSLAGSSVPTVETSSISISTMDEALYIDRSKVTLTDVSADNGVIHAIDKVLIPPGYFNVVETAQADGRFNTLVAAVVEAELVETLSTTPNLTVFAPTDEAFTDLVAETDAFDSASDILMLSNLSDILTYHVLGQEVVSSAALALAGSTTTPMNSAADLAISYVDPDLFINTSKVLVADVDAENGVIHAIDKVLLPPSADMLSNTDVTIGELVTALASADSGAEFTLLLAALQQEGLDTALVGEGPFTVFAPTDDAFEALIASSEGLNDASDLLALPNLSDILSQHVIPNAAIDSVTAYAANGGTVPTLLEGTSLSVNIDMGALSVGNATVVMTDVEASNGIIHVIGDVITIP